MVELFPGCQVQSGIFSMYVADQDQLIQISSNTYLKKTKIV